MRELEAEAAELRRGVWRDRRRGLQPELGADAGGEAASEFDDVDLSGGPPSPRRAPAPSFRGASSLQDVIASGISAFTGAGLGGRRGSAGAGAGARQPPRRQSLGLLGSDDGSEVAFDEEAFRAAREEEDRKRIERVREVKRGLKRWEGWRADVVDVRAGMGGVFDV